MEYNKRSGRKRRIKEVKKRKIKKEITKNNKEKKIIKRCKKVQMLKKKREEVILDSIDNIRDLFSGCFWN